MNQKPATVQEKIIEAFVSGASVRHVAREFRVAKGTALRLRKMAVEWGWEFKRCACGERAGHRGWCAERVRASPARRAFLSRWISRVERRWISVAERAQELGQRVAVLNGVTCWATTWKQGLVSPVALWPVTHYTTDTRAFRQFPRPYPGRPLTTPDGDWVAEKSVPAFQ